VARGEPEQDQDGGRRLSSGRVLAATAILIIALFAGVAALLQWTTPPRPPVSLVVPLPPAPIPKPPASAEAPAPTAPSAGTPTQTAVVPPGAPPKLTPPAKGEPLPPAPDPGLVEQSALGPLPKVGPDGRKPWQVYARPFERSDRRPRVAVLVTGLGLSGAASEAAINDLPGGVTLAFNPYAPQINDWIERARAAGHEVLLSLAMEPSDYPRIDPGPHTLLVSLDRQQNLERLQWVLSRVTGYVGVVTSAGSRFTTSQGDLLPVLDEIKRRGIMFVDNRATDRSVAGPLAKSIGLPRANSDVALDQPQVSRDAIDQRLQQLETQARQTGAALGIGEVYPVTIERLALWIPGLERKGIALAPVSAVADLQADRAPGASP